MLDGAGVVSLEFAIIAPVMLLMVIGAYDAARVLIIEQEAQNAAGWIAHSAAELAVTEANSPSDNIPPANANVAMTLIYAAMPGLKTGYLTGQYSVTLSAVAYGLDPACQVNCGQVPQLAWTVPLPVNLGNAATIQTVTRSCGILGQTANAPDNSSTLAVMGTIGVSQPGTTIVADIHYKFTPLFYNFITGSVDIWRTAYHEALGGAVNQELDYDFTNYMSEIGPNGPVCPSNANLTFK